MLSIMVCPPGFLCSQGLARDPQRSATLCPRGFYCPGGGIVSQRKINLAKECVFFFLNDYGLVFKCLKCGFHHRTQTPFRAPMVHTVSSLDCVMPVSVSSVLRGSTVTPSSLRSSQSPGL